MRTPLKVLIFIISAAIFEFLFFGQEADNLVCFGMHCFSVEIADTNAKRERGLMFRASLEKNKGMLFVFEKEGDYPFWMKNTLIPLDIIWMDQSGQIVYASKNLQPCGGTDCPATDPEVNAKYVLEINAGLMDELGLLSYPQAGVLTP